LRRSCLRSFVFLELIDLGQASVKAYWKQFLDKLRSITQEGPTPTFRWGLSPHTPFTVSKELLQNIRHYLNDHQDLLTSIHVAESREESHYFQKGMGPIADRIKILNPDWTLPRKTTPVQYLNDCGWLPKLDLGVHMNLVNKKDLQLLAKNRTAVVHCPGSHLYFSHPPFRYHQMRQHHIPVCLGTDSLASNQSLSMFREMRLFQKSHSDVTAHEILSMVTVKPAQALGLGSQIGKIKPGYLADLIGIPLSPKTHRFKDMAQQVLGHKGTVSFSMIHGELKLRLT
jgi:aminodeoxyfutalosine deaminase